MKRWGVGLIGAGGRGLAIMHGLSAREEYSLVIAADPDPQRLRHLRESVPGRYLVTDRYEEVLAASGVDLVVIASPDFVHEEQAVAAFEADKDVFLEKPIAITAAGGERVIRARDAAGKLLLIGFVLRYTGLMRRAKELVDQGAIGRPTTAWVLHSVASGGVWYFHDWHSTFANTGGLLLQKGSHDFDLINWFAGSPAADVLALGSRDVFGGGRPDDLRCRACDEKDICAEFLDTDRAVCAFRGEVDVLDNHLVLVNYENGFKASYQECHYTPEDNREFIFIGTEGKISVDFLADRILWRPRHRGRERAVFEGCSAGEGGHSGGDAGILRELTLCLDRGTRPLAGGEEGLEAIRVGLAAHESIRTGGPVRIVRGGPA